MALKALLNQKLDGSVSLQPTRIFYIQKLTGQGHSSIRDFTAQLQSSYRFDLDSEFLDLAQLVQNANPATQPVWQLSRERWYSNSKLAVAAPNFSGERIIVANWHSPIMAMGTTKISFKDASVSAHNITVEPVAVTSRAQGFVKDSLPYLWEASLTAANVKGTGRGTFSLFRSPSSESGSKKVEIAKYQSMSGKCEIGGVLVLDEREINPLVAVLTLLAVLGQRDSFNNLSSRAV